jgi:hypothetical protein
MNSRNILLVYYCLCAVRNTHRESAADVGQLSEVTRREQAIVLIGLIIIAVVLMALGGSGIQRRHTDNTPMMSARARGTAPCAWSTVPSMASSSPVWRGDGI